MNQMQVQNEPNAGTEWNKCRYRMNQMQAQNVLNAGTE